MQYKLPQLAFSLSVKNTLSTGGVVGSVSKVLSKGKLKVWDPGTVTLGSKQICRGMTKAQLNHMLKIKQITQIEPSSKFIKSKVEDVEHSDIGRQVIRGGDPNLLSFTYNIRTANLYGANRYWLPGDGAIAIGCLPAVFTDISEQAIMCPQMCEKEQKKAVERLLQGGDYDKEAPDVAQVTAQCDEICAVVGKQKGVSFGGMYSVDRHVQKILHVVGTGRPRLGLVPVSSCLVETFINPDYHERALAVKIVLTKKPEHLEILTDTMTSAKKLEPGQRVLTVDDAALIVSDPELNVLFLAAAGPSGTTILDSVPKALHGPEMLEYLKSTLREELERNSILKEDMGHTHI
ncbi:Uncharacterised protein [Legionella steigerwaltii]|uniref:Uncharacterized protein n=1 Tax=Legionella steigerwaltii TaxID=460 RepID=A0A378L3U7_9GAMM|nr:hypothetical protein [Legionella steigerwaltii]KTD69806.1 hypothetical protein Lstg_3425 [Legionella steigerwaltii]STY21466.1 Uncharacterised protein [Legionella steigerwaltii]